MVILTSSRQRQSRRVLPGSNMIHYHDVKQRTTAELERAKRDLKANLGLIAPDSPAHVPIQALLRAIDAELAERAGNRPADGTSTTAARPVASYPPASAEHLRES